MHPVLKGLAAVVGGVAAGLAITWGSIGVLGRTNVDDGPWHTGTLIGSTASGPYLRAYVALHGLFALSRSEAMYYSAGRDSDGRRLSGDCVYAVTGRDPDARWWSLTAYGADDFLIPNPARRYSVSGASLARHDGAFVIPVAQTGRGDGWIAVRPGRFNLMLRLYNPAPRVAADPAHAILPAIRRVSCR